MELIGRILLLLLVVASPWAFGSVTPEPLFVICLSLAGLLVWRFIETLFIAPDRPSHIPVAVLAPLGLLLIASVQLLPRGEGVIPQMQHAVFEEFADEVAVEGPTTGTISVVTTRTQAAKLFFAMAAFFLASVWFVTPRSQVWLWGILAINGAALGFFGIVQRLTWNGMLFWQVPLRFGGTPFASYVNRNNAAGYLNLCLAASLGWLLLQIGPRISGLSDSNEVMWKGSHSEHGRRRSGHRLPWKVRILSRIASVDGAEIGVLGLVTLMGAALMFSLSRGGILAGVIAPLLTLMVYRRFSPHRGDGISIWGVLGAVGVSGAATVGLLLWLQGGEQVAERIASLGDPFAAAEGRLIHWWDTSGAVLDFPILGTGLGTYRYANLPYQAHTGDAWYVNADNHFFELLVETGVLGFVCFTGGFVLTFLASVSLLRQADPSMWAAGIVGLGAVFSQAIQSVTDFGLLIPANGVTFAVICGAVCGLACNAADFKQFRISSWLSLVRLEGRGSSILLSLVLAITAGMYGLEIFGATRSSVARNTVIRILPHRPLDTRMAVLEDAIEASIKALQLRPDDPELHQAVAHWWIDRYRLQAFREIREPLGELPGHRVLQLWNSTSLPVLHAQVAEIAEKGGDEQLEAIRRIPAIRSNLGHAYRHLLEASRQNPLMRDNASTLAHLAILQDPGVLSTTPDEDEERFIKLALFLGPSTPSELFTTGLLADSVGRISLSQIALGRYLNLSGDHMVAAWGVLTNQAEVGELILKVVPPRLDVLVALAEASSDQDAKQRLVARGQELANEVNFSDSAEFSYILLARLAELQGETAKAIEAYGKAIQRSPDDIEPRLKRARLLKRDGQLEQAENEYSVLRILAPKRRDIEKELQDLRLQLNLQ